MYTVLLLVFIVSASTLLALCVDERLNMQTLYDEDEQVWFVRLDATCMYCNESHGTDVTEDKWLEYCNGAFVQDVWPHRSVMTREIIIANRPGNPFGPIGYMCQQCNDDLFGEDDV